MLEWASVLAPLKVADVVLKHFLDGSERRLRKSKLEAEIEALARQQTTSVDTQELNALTQEVLTNVRILCEQVPGVTYTDSKLLGVALERDKKTFSATESLRRLEIAVNARRQVVTQSTKPDTPPEVVQPQEILWSAPTATTAGLSTPQSADPPLPANADEQKPTSFEWSTRQPAPNPESRRLSQLERRIRDRRKSQ